MNRFLLGSLSLFLFALVLTVGVYLAVAFFRTPPESVAEIKQAIDAAVGRDSSDTKIAASSSAAALIPDGGLPLASLALSTEQKATLEKLGISVDSFVLTEAMVLCAEGKLGTDRIKELVGKAAPTALEVARLTPCLIAS